MIRSDSTRKSDRLKVGSLSVIPEKLKDLPSPHSTSNKNAHERYKSMIMKDEELSGPRPKADILLSKQNEISA